MTNLANHCDRGKADTRQVQSEMCMIVGWRRIPGAWKDVHAVVCNGAILIREETGYRVMHSEGVTSECVERGRLS
jgi:hypothetical protein